jgi:hypothetical protein
MEVKFSRHGVELQIAGRRDGLVGSCGRVCYTFLAGGVTPRTDTLAAQEFRL